MPSSKGNAAVRLLFVPQYASHLYRSTPSACTSSAFEKIAGVGGSGKFLKTSMCIVRGEVQKSLAIFWGLLIFSGAPVL